jgi:peptidoglycan/LPS O-acetylase OafA/YrhL
MPPSHQTTPTAAKVAAGAAIIIAIGFTPATDGLFFPYIVLGPLLTGAVAAARRRSWRPVAAAWALFGLAMFVLDWAINDEDQVFHVGVTAVMVGLVALGAALGRLVPYKANASGTVSASNTRMQ